MAPREIYYQQPSWFICWTDSACWTASEQPWTSSCSVEEVRILGPLDLLARRAQASEQLGAQMKSWEIYGMPEIKNLWPLSYLIGTAVQRTKHLFDMKPQGNPNLNRFILWIDGCRLSHKARKNNKSNKDKKLQQRRVPDKRKNKIGEEGQEQKSGRANGLVTFAGALLDGPSAEPTRLVV